MAVAVKMPPCKFVGIALEHASPFLVRASKEEAPARQRAREAAACTVLNDCLPRCATALALRTNVARPSRNVGATD